MSNTNEKLPITNFCIVMCSTHGSTSGLGKVQTVHVWIRCPSLLREAIAIPDFQSLSVRHVPSIDALIPSGGIYNRMDEPLEPIPLLACSSVALAYQKIVAIVGVSTVQCNTILSSTTRETKSESSLCLQKTGAKQQMYQNPAARHGVTNWEFQHLPFKA